jgi:hypothetical protein
VLALRKCKYCNKDRPLKDFDQNKKSGHQCNFCKNQRRQDKINSTPFTYMHNLCTQLRYSRKKQKIEWRIEPQDLYIIYAKQEGRCALTNVELTHKRGSDEESDFNISIDRIDPNLGYFAENIQLVGKVVNFLKSDLPQEKFIKLINLIYNNTNSKAIVN